MMKYLAIIGVLFLSGCGSINTASTITLDAAFDYICKGARVGPLSKRLQNTQERQAYIILCSDFPPIVPIAPKVKEEKI